MNEGAFELVSTKYFFTSNFGEKKFGTFKKVKADSKQRQIRITFLTSEFAKKHLLTKFALYFGNTFSSQYFARFLAMFYIILGWNYTKNIDHEQSVLEACTARGSDAGLMKVGPTKV